MQADRQIAIWGGWIAGPAFGVAMMAAPDYLKLSPPYAGVVFWGGIAIFFLTLIVVFVLSLHEQEKKHRVIGPILLMAVGAIIFGAGAAWYFWPIREGIEAHRPVVDNDKPRPPLDKPPSAAIAEAPIAIPSIPAPPIAPPFAAIPEPVLKAPATPTKEIIDVTPEFLVGLYEGQTDLGGRTRASKYIGKWMPVHGPLFEFVVGGWPMFGGRAPVVASLASKGPVVTMVFSGESIDRIAMVAANQNISVLGKIKEIERSKIVLEDCDLMDFEFR